MLTKGLNVLIDGLKNMVFTKKQEEELITLTYKALKKLTGGYSNAYTTASSIIYVVAHLATDEVYGSYQQNRVLRILNKFCREGQAKKIQIIVYSPVGSRLRVRRKSYGYRVSP